MKNIKNLTTPLLSFLVVSFQCTAQGKEKTISSIYASVVAEFYHGKSGSFVISDSTVNDYIVKTSYNKIADGYASEVPPMDIDTDKMDSSWVITLREAEKQKHQLHHDRIPLFKIENMDIQFVGKSKKTSLTGGDKVTLSSIILIKNRAIVEMTHSGDILDGGGVILFLQKSKGKWIIVSKLQTWVS